MVLNGILNPYPPIWLWKYIQLGPTLSVFWGEIDDCVRNMDECNREVVIKTEWNEETKRLVVRVIDRLLGAIIKEEEASVVEDELVEMMKAGIFSEEEVRRHVDKQIVYKRVSRDVFLI